MKLCNGCTPFYKPIPTISKRPEDKQDSKTLGINNQPGLVSSEKILICIPIFKNGSA